MALLIDNRADGAGGAISPDLSAAMEIVQRDMGTPADEDAIFDLSRSRRNIALRARLAARDLVLPPVATTERQLATPVGNIVLRTYNPASDGAIVAFVHGGGWIGGSIDSHDSMARWFAHEAGSTIVSIGYSLAPEHPFPHAVIEVAAAIAALTRDIAPGRRLFVMGDSAGASIASMALLRLSPLQRKRVNGFVSIYGAYSPEMDLSSHRLYGDGRFGLSESRMRWCWTLYAPQFFPEGREQLTPLSRIPSDFPPTLCIGAECDVLLDDTLAFYSRLAEAQIDVSLSLWPGLPHGCLHYVGVVDSVTTAARSIVHFIGDHRPALRAIQPVVAPPPAEGPEVLRDISALFPPQRSRSSGSITHRLAIDILGGKLKPGAALSTEEDASAALGVSRSAYREAMRTLSAKGLVVSSPKVGTKIAPRSRWSILDTDVLAWMFEAEPDDQFIRDLFDLRKTVEPAAALLAADRRDDAELARLADALARMSAAPADTRQWLDASADFHRTILEASRNEAFIGLWPAVSSTIVWSVKLRMMLPPSTVPPATAAEHGRVFDALASQHGTAASTEMSHLIEASLGDAMVDLGRVRRARAAL